MQRYKIINEEMVGQAWMGILITAIILVISYPTSIFINKIVPFVIGRDRNLISTK